jgi:hypothetical protein
MKCISEADFSVLESKHSKVAKVETELGDIVLRKPNRAEFRAAWAKGIFDLKMQVNLDALDRMVRDLCIFPSLAELDSILDDAPGALLLCLDPIVRLSGMVQRERSDGSAAS